MDNFENNLILTAVRIRSLFLEEEICTKEAEKIEDELYKMIVKMDRKGSLSPNGRKALMTIKTGIFEAILERE